MRSSRWGMSCGGLILLAVLSGCQPTLETGYRPRPLNASEAQMRGYYAPAFSRDSRAAEEERAQQLQSRRPTR